MKLLIIEDNEETVKGICDYAQDHGWEHVNCDFDNASEQIAIFDPEIIVMDWMYDAEEIDKGAPILGEVYHNRFRPIIVFSAVANTIELPPEIKNTPLVEILSKGDEEIVIKRIEEWTPYIRAINNLHLELKKSLLSSVQAIDNFMKMEQFPGDDVIKYMLNKRTTYYFDNEYIGSVPPAWIQYEYPPIQGSLIVADVLRICSSELIIDKPGKPEEYCVILTPSCDMARAKAGQLILVAHCSEANTYTDDAVISKKEQSGEVSIAPKIDRLKKSLNTGYNYAKVALPALPNKVPYMTINLKIIEQLAIEEVAISEKHISETSKYYRVASINSPFREQIVWAHMINSCRPGMPDRNITEWAEGILKP